MNNKVITINSYDFIKLDLRGISKAVKHKHSDEHYYNYVGLVMLILMSDKYEIYIPTIRKYPKIIYFLFRKTIITESLIAQFKGKSIDLHKIMQPVHDINTEDFSQDIGGFQFYDFTNLKYMEGYS